MISNEHLLIQIEKQVLKAKVDPNDQTVRETFAAIRALCDVVLDSSPSPTPQAVTTSSTSVMSVQSTGIKEEGANGDSLFDF